MEQSFKQFGAWGIRLKHKLFRDEFLVARLKLTSVYLLTALAILGISSLILYRILFAQFSESILETNLPNHQIHELLDRAQDNLQYKIVAIDGAIIILVIGLGFLLTAKTLKPIKKNMMMQKRFIADASHEMRTPVAVVISGLEVALRNKGLDLEGAKKTIESTLEEMREFSKLSNDLLNVSMYDLPVQKPFAPVHMRELITGIVEKMRPLAIAKGLSINLSSLQNPQILGDNMELTRVFYNILTNAITHTEKGVITVSDSSTLDLYTLRISDTGVGIGSDALSKIFDPFFRGDAARSTAGAGLGLTLTKKIVQHHHGSIDITSTVGAGTTVSITLPLSS